MRDYKGRSSDSRIIQYPCPKDAGKFLNNDALPLILMLQVFDPKTKNLVQTIEKTFHGDAFLISDGT